MKFGSLRGAVLFALAVLALAAPSAWAVQPLDPSFGQDGISLNPSLTAPPEGIRPSSQNHSPCRS